MCLQQIGVHVSLEHVQALFFGLQASQQKHRSS